MPQQYFVVAADGNEYGPATAEQLAQWVAENRLGRKTLLRRDGDNVQMMAGVFSELSHLFVQAPATGAPPVAQVEEPRASISLGPVTASGMNMPQGALTQGSPLIPVVVLCVLAGVLSLVLVGVPALFFGVGALIMSLQANAQYQAGENTRAQELVQRARRFLSWGWVLLVVGLMVAALVGRKLF